MVKKNLIFILALLIGLTFSIGCSDDSEEEGDSYGLTVNVTYTGGTVSASNVLAVYFTDPSDPTAGVVAEGTAESVTAGQATIEMSGSSTKNVQVVVIYDADNDAQDFSPLAGDPWNIQSMVIDFMATGFGNISDGDTYWAYDSKDSLGGNGDNCGRTTQGTDEPDTLDLSTVDSIDVDLDTDGETVSFLNYIIFYQMASDEQYESYYDDTGGGCP